MYIELFLSSNKLLNSDTGRVSDRYLSFVLYVATAIKTTTTSNINYKHVRTASIFSYNSIGWMSSSSSPSPFKVEIL